MTVLVEDARADDTAAVATLQMLAFDADRFGRMFPARDGVGERYLVRGWGGVIDHSVGAGSSSPSRLRVSVIRDSSSPSTIHGACLFYIVNPPPTNTTTASTAYTDDDANVPTSWRDRWGEPLDGMDVELTNTFFEAMRSQHYAVMGHERPHIYLEIIMTHPDARGRGYAKVLLQHVNELADRLGLPLYLDSDEVAVGLYRRVGYVAQPEEMRQSDYSVPMVREPVARAEVGRGEKPLLSMM